MRAVLDCCMLGLIITLIFEDPGWDIIIRAWKPICYAGIMSCGVAYTLQILAQKDLKPTVASLIMSLESVIAAIAGWVILGGLMSGRVDIRLCTDVCGNYYCSAA